MLICYYAISDGDICSNRKAIALKVVNDSHSSLHVRLYVKFVYLMLTLYTYFIPMTAVLPKPMNAPVLIRVADNQQIYDVGIPIEIELQVYDNPSLLFRIEDQSQPGEYVYQWMVDVVFDLPEITMMEYLLNLNTFIGRTVNIAYAFATKQGLSEYSDTVELRLFREIVPVSPSDSGHALVTRDADEAQNTALCHVFCINSLFQSVSGNNSNTTSSNETVSVNGTTSTTTLTPMDLTFITEV